MSNPKGQDAASGHLPKRGENRQEYLQVHVQLWEEKPRLGHLLRTQKTTDRTSPDGEKKDQGKETCPSDASSIACRSHRWTSDGDACWVEMSPDAADGWKRRAQQREQEEDHTHQQEPQSQHQKRLHRLQKSKGTSEPQLLKLAQPRPQHRQPLQGMKIPTGSKRTWRDLAQQTEALLL